MGLKHFRLVALGLTPFVMLFLSTIDSPQVSAQSTGEWVNSSTIRYEGKLYRDTNPGDTSYAFIQEGASRACVNTSHGATRLTTNTRPSETSTTTFTHVNVTIQPTEPPCMSTRTSVSIGPAGSATNGGTGTSGGATEEGTDEVTCAIGNALGWIICPVTEALAHTTFLAADILEHFLYTEPLLLNASGNQDDPRAGTYLVWSSVRNLANIILVFGFFAIVFSQATSMGISSYGIKRLLPRLVIVAILINLSYFICALIIDIFNIMGGSVAGFFSAANNAIPNAGDSEFGLVSIITSMMAGLGLAAGLYAFGGALFALAWPFVVPAMVIVVTAVLTATVVLIFREVALVLLVIVSPLAFAAWLLPNTENWFNRWKSLFQNLLIMYPLMMALIYGSFLAYNILQATSGLNPFIMSLVGLIIVAMPLFSLPFLIKFAGNIGARIGAFTNNPNRGMIDRSKKWARSKSDLSKQEAKARYVQNQGPGAYVRGSDKSRLNNYLKNKRAGAQQFVGGYSAKKAFEEERRSKEAQRAQTANVAGIAATDARYQERAAGVGGEQGKSRVIGYAESTLDQLEGEDIKVYYERLSDTIAATREGRRVRADGTVDMTGKTLNKDESFMALARGEKVATLDGKHVYDATNNPYLARAAVDQLSKEGRVEQIRILQEEFKGSQKSAKTAGNTQLEDYYGSKVGMVTKSINNNVGSIVTKAPDLVKGMPTAVSDVEATAIPNLHESTIKAMLGDINTRLADPKQQARAQVELDRFMTSLTQAVNDPRIAPSLKGKQLIAIREGVEGAVNKDTGKFEVTYDHIASAVSRPAGIDSSGNKVTIQQTLSRIDKQTGKIIGDPAIPPAASSPDQPSSPIIPSTRAQAPPRTTTPADGTINIEHNSTRGPASPTDTTIPRAAAPPPPPPDEQRRNGGNFGGFS